jgi:hypothetical protein
MDRQLGGTRQKDNMRTEGLKRWMEEWAHKGMLMVDGQMKHPKRETRPRPGSEAKALSATGNDQSLKLL